MTSDKPQSPSKKVYSALRRIITLIIGLGGLYAGCMLIIHFFEPDYSKKTWLQTKESCSIENSEAVSAQKICKDITVASGTYTLSNNTIWIADSITLQQGATLLIPNDGHHIFAARLLKGGIINANGKAAHPFKSNDGQNGRTDGSGTPGTHGVHGGSGKEILVISPNIVQTKLTAIGGNGGNGRNGNCAGFGGWVSNRDGNSGSNGGNAGNGGNGGTIVVVAPKTREVPDVAFGNRGDVGAGGNGGKGGRGCNGLGGSMSTKADGSPGNPGISGQNGSNGRYSLQNELDFSHIYETVHLENEADVFSGMLELHNRYTNDIRSTTAQ